MTEGDPGDSLRARVAAFDYWHYEFDLGGGVVTPIANPANAVRHRERRRYFFDRAVELLDGLEGRHVLDLGCNAGYWTLAALEAGAEFVLAVDGRRTLLDQAALVLDAKGVDPARYELRCADLFDLDPGRSFDLVLCLGLLYHVNRPVELVQRLAAWARDVVVIDTDLSLLPGSALELRHEPLDDPRNALASELIFCPTRDAVVDLVRAQGLEIVTLPPEFASWEGSSDFRDGRRRAFIAAKTTLLAGLPDEPAPTAAPAPQRGGLRRVASRLAGR